MILIRQLRVYQWVKNLLILAPLFFARQMSFSGVVKMIPALVSFCLLASSIYIINDLADLDADRQHPRKKQRPLASGDLEPKSAYALIAGLTTTSAILAVLLCPQVLYLLACYALLNISYSLYLKRIPVLDVLILASGYVLRIWLGGIIANVAMSHWIFICTFLGAVLLSLGKRKSEIAIQTDAKGTETTSPQYSSRYTYVAIALVSLLLATSYGLYSIDTRTISFYGTNQLIWTSTLVLLGIGRYLQLAKRNQRTDDPTRLFLTDVPMILIVGAWLVMFNLMVA